MCNDVSGCDGVRVGGVGRGEDRSRSLRQAVTSSSDANRLQGELL